VIDLGLGYGFVNAHASPEPKGIIGNMKNKRMDVFSFSFTVLLLDRTGMRRRVYDEEK